MSLTVIKKSEKKTNMESVNNITNWSNKDVLELLHKEKIAASIVEICQRNDIDGQCLLSLVDRDFYEVPFNQLHLNTLGERKRFVLLVKKLQRNNRSAMFELGLSDDDPFYNPSTNINFLGTNLSHLSYNLHKIPNSEFPYGRNSEFVSNYGPEVKASRLKPEIWKTAIALGKSSNTMFFMLCDCSFHTSLWMSAKLQK